MDNNEPKTPAKHTVKQGIAYATIGDAITRNYVVLGGKRIYVFAEAGTEITAAEAKKAAKAPAPVENSSTDSEA